LAVIGRAGLQYRAIAGGIVSLRSLARRAWWCGSKTVGVVMMRRGDILDARRRRSMSRFGALEGALTGLVRRARSAWVQAGDECQAGFGPRVRRRIRPGRGRDRRPMPRRDATMNLPPALLAGRIGGWSGRWPSGVGERCGSREDARRRKTAGWGRWGRGDERTEVRPIYSRTARAAEIRCSGDDEEDGVCRAQDRGGVRGHGEGSDRGCVMKS